MPFASRDDLLARCNARRLAQLAVPADREMVSDEALRLAIDNGNLSVYTVAEQTSLALALDAIDKALQDADALLISYGIANTVQTTLLARLCSTVALYYLQGAERMTEDVKHAYEGAIATLKAHARGELSLVPAAPDAPALVTDVVSITSNPSRYIPNGAGVDWDEW